MRQALSVEETLLCAIAHARPDLDLRSAVLTPLGGGVSNSVFRVDVASGAFVIKQALGQLRVAETWLADRERILREARSLTELAPHLPTGAVPRVLFEDRENFVYAMEAVEGEDWKSLLRAGTIDTETAAGAAGILGGILRATAGSAEFRSGYQDQHCFDQLRLDPYYRFTAARHPDLAGAFEDAERLCRTRLVSLVHGDFSPKNLLVAPGRVTLIDFEVVHYGDPAFDAAFLLNHLALKMVDQPAHSDRLRDAAYAFWTALAPALPEAAADFERAVVTHLGCLHLARVDGKSPAEYLTTPVQHAQVRQQARRWILNPQLTLREIFNW